MYDFRHESSTALMYGAPLVPNCLRNYSYTQQYTVSAVAMPINHIEISKIFRVKKYPINSNTNS